MCCEVLTRGARTIVLRRLPCWGHHCGRTCIAHAACAPRVGWALVFCRLRTPRAGGARGTQCVAGWRTALAHVLRRGARRCAVSTLRVGIARACSDFVRLQQRAVCAELGLRVPYWAVDACVLAGHWDAIVAQEACWAGEACVVVRGDFARGAGHGAAVRGGRAEGPCGCTCAVVGGRRALVGRKRVLTGRLRVGAAPRRRSVWGACVDGPRARGADRAARAVEERVLGADTGVSTYGAAGDGCGAVGAGDAKSLGSGFVDDLIVAPSGTCAVDELCVEQNLHHDVPASLL
eukprot:2295136-Rhodomonas_salina.1